MIKKIGGMKGPPEEEWRPVAGWPYLVSNMGRVVRVESCQLKTFLPQRFNSAGRPYPRFVQLKQHDQVKKVMVGNLVMEAFVGPRPPNSIVLYLDGNVNNNDLKNLRYATRGEAALYHQGLESKSA